ncbi:hypothetical protein BgiBS90_011788 [Biomphalaria glabrata]|nr:hypothetical protein BgiBS90_011788 [Biomphalaria glabrata]
MVILTISVLAELGLLLGHHKFPNYFLVSSDVLLTIGAPNLSYQLLGHFKCPIKCWGISFILKTVGHLNGFIVGALQVFYQLLWHPNRPINGWCTLSIIPTVVHLMCVLSAVGAQVS